MVVCRLIGILITYSTFASICHSVLILIDQWTIMSKVVCWAQCYLEHNVSINKVFA